MTFDHFLTHGWAPLKPPYIQCTAFQLRWHQDSCIVSIAGLHVGAEGGAGPGLAEIARKVLRQQLASGPKSSNTLPYQGQDFCTCYSPGKPDKTRQAVDQDYGNGEEMSRKREANEHNECSHECHSRCHSCRGLSVAVSMAPRWAVPPTQRQRCLVQCLLHGTHWCPLVPFALLLC